MRIEIRSHAMNTPREVHDHIRRRIGFSLSRFSDRIGSVTLRLTDLNGPKGGEDKHVRLILTVPGEERIVIEETDPNLLAAVDNAIGRSARTLARVVDRGRTFQRRRVLA